MADIGEAAFAVIVICVWGIVHAKRLLFVDIGPANGDGNGEDGDVHHNHVRGLDGRVNLGKIHGAETSRPGARSLKPTDKESDIERELFYGWGIELFKRLATVST